jgi:hypothetical protein
VTWCCLVGFVKGIIILIHKYLAHFPLFSSWVFFYIILQKLFIWWLAVLFLPLLLPFTKVSKGIASHLAFALHSGKLSLILSEYGNSYAEYMLINSQVANLIDHTVYLNYLSWPCSSFTLVGLLIPANFLPAAFASN